MCAEQGRKQTVGDEVEVVAAAKLVISTEAGAAGGNEVEAIAAAKWLRTDVIFIHIFGVYIERETTVVI